MAAVLLPSSVAAFGGRCHSVHFSASVRTLSGLRGGSSSATAAEQHEYLPISLPDTFKERQEDVHVALLSVLHASRVTRHLQPIGSSVIQTISKQDASPVTVGDFASQAVALDTIHNTFANSDIYIAEEGSDALRNDEELLEKVWGAVNHVHKGDLNSQHDLLKAIDYGQGIDEEDQSAVTKRRVWTLDPIDGTKGFLRGREFGGQYCIALALIEDGEPVVSVLGCPNLPLPSTESTKTIPYGAWSENEIINDAATSNSGLFSSSRGCLFVAVRGGGCYEIPLHILEKYLLEQSAPETSSADLPWKRLHVTASDGTAKAKHEATFCLGVERGFSDPKGTVLKIAQVIHGPDALTVGDDGIPDIKNSLRMDGQGKYGLLARGDAEYFLRLPKDGYVDWVWDVAAGFLCLAEAGGKMSDVNGNAIEFSDIGKGRKAKLPDHIKGIFGSNGGTFHDELVSAFDEVNGSEANL
eukprot:CAMPEP_0201727978 /NCGR_PEP_ID=MMETSP0593-20130828/14344_1 /ASSEMBLY_ACC=CAM_ASM_000672 /TAXON_ID=267983 /ORGANISM="Skeletonema japonicum, Strain CCMP2506" /LENGTH=468 /DNA_ID=CAMNT_0048219945 /DNA_START=1 /DNA_END=1405 /DNA_ORIENTATION=+